MPCTTEIHRAFETKYCPNCGDRLRPDPVRVHTRAELQSVALGLGVRPDWHEPDEQEVTASVEGDSFDNAGFWPDETCSEQLRDGGGSEMCVKLHQDGKLIAVVNLATLFAMACGTVD